MKWDTLIHSLNVRCVRQFKNKLFPFLNRKNLLNVTNAKLISKNIVLSKHIAGLVEGVKVGVVMTFEVRYS